MNIDYTVTALMFPAIPLIMAVYSNRFHTLSALIRKLHDEHVFEKHIPPEWKKQLKNLGLSIDWDREISTCSSEYYKHQQSLFLQCFLELLPKAT